MQSPPFLSALPGYLGGKRRLAPLIFAEIAAAHPRASWPTSTFLDPFCGGGSVALWAKALGFHVIASDRGTLGATVARALIANSSARLTPADVRGLGLDRQVPSDGRLDALVPAVFGAEQAEWLARAALQAECLPEPRRSLLQLLVARLALRCQPMAMLTATDARAAATGEYDRVSSRRLAHYLRVPGAFASPAVWALAQRLNAGVIAGSGQARRADALTTHTETQADVVYLDPPYAGTTGYAGTYAPLDALLGGAETPGAAPAIDQLVLATMHIPLLVLSYGGPRTSLESLIAQVGAHRPVHRALAIPYPHLRSLAREEKNRANQEFLIVAGR
ncbi:MAG: hypothetical protein EPO65_05465 [Dehalococcoidia bacterium]|nr:MAG: hypothetical protein EPO65_05465 [Dehalococcoidia bacterium]